MSGCQQLPYYKIEPMVGAQARYYRADPLIAGAVHLRRVAVRKYPAAEFAR